LKEYGDKVPADKKAPIEQALGKLKEAHKSQNIASIDTATAELNTAWAAASEDMYKASQAGGQPGEGGGPNGSNGSQGGPQQPGDGHADTVTDAEFEEVK